MIVDCARGVGFGQLDANMEGVTPGDHFVDLPAADLHLAAGSRAIDGGVVLPAGAADEDYDGDRRDGTPDIGADEV